MALTPVPESPQWWVRRLHKQLAERQHDIERMDAYYRGEPPAPPWLPEQAQREFHRLLTLTKANYMGLVVDSVAERMQVEGFRVGDTEEADQDTWRIWQNNNLDNDSDQALLEALINGCSYLLVAPNRDGSTADVFVEHPSQAIIEYAPGSGRRERAAGLKVWKDDWTGKLMATLYLPGNLYKFETDKSTTGLSTGQYQWRERAVPNEEFGATNPLGVVPLVELANNPRLLTGGVSEIADVTPIQDRICKTIADRLMTQDYGAFPQKWAVGYPAEDADGRPNKIDIGRNRMVQSDVAETKFGQWDAAPLDPYSAAKREDVKDIASRTRTPAQYLLGELSNVNGQTLKAAESGLVSKVRQRMRPYGEGFEEAMRLARRIEGLPEVPDEGKGMETIWRNPEFRTEGELATALTQMASIGVPHEALWEMWGATQAQIKRWKSQQDDQAQRDLSGLLKPPPAAPGEVQAPDQVA